MAEEEDRLFDDLDRLLRAIGDDALSLVMHLNEGIEAFRVQAVLVLGFVFVLTLFVYLGLYFTRPEIAGWVPYHLAIGMYVGVVLCAAWLEVRTIRTYRLYRGRYSRMIETAKKYKGTAKSNGKAA